ncbi:zinc-ribbon domain-containing protein [Actinoplanes sp. NPDC020271]|uniref:zinc-ribbon domain-containing protein n=1 Tax=Actinoplanes sp. NPDC020271 TaxID=3363896 RepID=UPI0037BD4DC4
MFFLLFGVRTKDDPIDTRVLTCEVCGWAAPQARFARTTRFTLFFVPLFPVAPRKSFLRCAHCMAFRQIKTIPAYV